MSKKYLFIFLVFFICFGCTAKTKEELCSEGVKQLKASNPSGAVVLFKNALEKDENYSEARFQLAKAYVRLGKYEQAEKELIKVIRQNPLRDEVTLELAGLYNSMKKTDEAFKLGEQYLIKHPGSVEGLEILGISSEINKRHNEAESYFLQALKADPSRAITKLELASVYISSGSEQKAKSFLEEVIKAEPQNIRAYYMLAALEKSMGNIDRSLEIYQKIVSINQADTLAAYKMGLIYIEKNELNKAESIADNLLKNFPKRADGYRLKGLVRYHRKNYSDAMISLQNSIKISPTLEGYYFLGLCYYNQGDLETALSQFRKILDNVPTSRQARLMTGTILLSQKRLDDAIAEIKKVLQNDDKDAIAHNMLGNAYMAKGMFEEGMHELNLATRIDPKAVDAYLKKGYFYFSRGKNAEGETELVTAVQAAPDVLNSRLLLASYYMRKGNGAKALSVIKSGLTGNKNDAPLYNAMAAVLFSENKRDEGLKSIQKAKDVDPAFPASYQNLATYYAALGNYDKAIAEQLTLLKIDPKNYQAMLGLAALYEIKGNDRDAQTYYQKAVDTKMPAAYLAQAGYYMKKKEAGQALQVLEEAIKNDSRNTSALEMKGRILVTEKKYKDAIRVFDELDLQKPDAAMALKINTYVAMKDIPKAQEQARLIIAKYPSSARGYLVLASILESQKDIVGAINEAKNGLKVDSNNIQALLYLGKLYETRKEYDQAKLVYDEACRKKPDYAPALFAQGALLDLTGKKKEAVLKYREVLVKSNAFVPAMNNLAYLCADGYGNREEALRLAITAFKLDPGNAGIMDTLGYSLLKNNRKAEAQKVLEKAADLLPNNPTVVYHLALAYKYGGDKPRAIKAVQKSLTLGNFPDSGAAKALLAELKK